MKTPEDYYKARGCEKRMIGFTVIVIAIIVMALTSCNNNLFSGMSGTDCKFLNKQYAGNLIEYKKTVGEGINIPVIWLKTTAEDTYGPIAVYGKKLKFQLHENLYLHLIYEGKSEWMYVIENERKQVYKVAQFSLNGKTLTQNWF